MKNYFVGISNVKYILDISFLTYKAKNIELGWLP